jgi:hypothetical protein
MEANRYFWVMITPVQHAAFWSPAQQESFEASISMLITDYVIQEADDRYCCAAQLLLYACNRSVAVIIEP